MTVNGILGEIIMAWYKTLLGGAEKTIKTSE
jgi:hypothetical protein